MNHQTSASFQVLIIILLFLGIAIPNSNVWAQSLEWTAPYYDTNNTNRSTANADILEPVVRWSHPVGLTLPAGSFWQGDLDGGETHDLVFVLNGKVARVRGDGQVLWLSQDLGITRIIGAWDFDGNERKELVVTSENAPAGILFLHDQTGELLWRFNGYAPSAGSFHDASITVDDLTGDGLPDLLARPQLYADNSYAFSFATGFEADPANNILWTFPHTIYKRLLPAVSGDVDNDGEKEVVILEAYYLHILDAATGVSEYRFENLGPEHTVYSGLLQLQNLDDDPQPEILLITDSPNSTEYSLTVIDAVERTISWQLRFTEISNKDLTFTENSLVDLNNDGSLEIVVSLYNDIDDESSVVGSVAGDLDGIHEPDRWVVAVFDAATGDLLAYRPDALLDSILDLNGDGIPEILVQQETQGTLSPASYLPLQSLTFTGTGFTENWTANDLSVVHIKTVTTSDTKPMYKIHTPLVFDQQADGIPRLVVLADDNQDTQADALVLLRADGSSPVREYTRLLQEHEQLTPLGIGYDLSIASQEWELAVFSNRGQLDLLNPRLGLENSIHQGSYEASMIAAKLSDNGPLELLVAGSDNRLLVLDATDAGPTTDPVLRLNPYLGVSPVLAVGPPDATGERMIPVRIGSDATNPVVALLDSQGQEQWRQELRGFASLPRAFRFGRFNADGVPDLLFSVFDQRQDTAHDFRLLALNGETGDILWNVAGDFNDLDRANSLFLTDTNSDNVDDILIINYNIGEIYNGVDGSLLTSFPNVYYPLWSMFVDLDQDTFYELLVANYTESTGVRRLELWPSQQISWTVNHENSSQFPKPGALFDDGGNWAVLRVGDVGFLDALDANGQALHSGKVYPRRGLLETVEPETSCVISSPAVADIDSDGMDEALFGSSDGYLYAMNLDDFSLLWSLSLGVPVGKPILADTDDDGELEILVPTADGIIQMVDEAALGASTDVRDVDVDEFGNIADSLTDLDSLERPGYLGASWNAVPDADGYRAAVLDENQSQLTPYQDVGNVTENVWPIQLVLGKTYLIAVVAYDTQGKAGPVAVSDGIRFTDTTAPQIQSFTLSTDRFSPDQSSLGISASLYDLGGLERYKILVTDQAARLVHQENEIHRVQSLDLATFWDGMEDADGLAAEDGTYTITLYVQDAAGQLVSQADSVLVDGTPPPIPSITEPSDNDEVNTPTPAFSGTGEAASQIWVYRADPLTALCLGVASQAGEWSCESSVELADGPLEVFATSKDDLGNESEPSPSLQLMVALPAEDGDIDGDEDGDIDVDEDGDTDGDEDGDIDGDEDGDTDVDEDRDIDVDEDGDIDVDEDGDIDGDEDGDIDGDEDGDTDGDEDGDTDVDEDGDTDGDEDGDLDGDKDGDTDGDEDGDLDGDEDGDIDVDEDGDLDGDEDGDTDGDEDGDLDGDEDGDIDVDEDGDLDGDEDNLSYGVVVTDEDGCGGCANTTGSSALWSLAVLFFWGLRRRAWIKL